jgi:hypothetical protein
MGVDYSNEEAIHQLLLGIPDSGTWAIFKQVTLTTIAEASDAETPFTFEKVANRLKAKSLHVVHLLNQPGPGSEYAQMAKEIRKHKNNPSGCACTNPLCST